MDNRINGVKIISANENISEGSKGIILEYVLEGMAEYYSVELAEKINRGTAFYGGIRAKCLRSLQNFFYIFQGVLGRNSYADVIRSD